MKKGLSVNKKRIPNVKTQKFDSIGNFSKIGIVGVIALASFSAVNYFENNTVNFEDTSYSFQTSMLSKDENMAIFKEKDIRDINSIQYSILKNFSVDIKKFHSNDIGDISYIIKKSKNGVIVYSEKMRDIKMNEAKKKQILESLGKDSSLNESIKEITFAEYSPPKDLYNAILLEYEKNKIPSDSLSKVFKNNSVVYNRVTGETLVNINIDESNISVIEGKILNILSEYYGSSFYMNSISPVNKNKMPSGVDLMESKILF